MLDRRKERKIDSNGDSALQPSIPATKRQHNPNKKSKVSSQNVMSIITAVILVLAHVAIAVGIIIASRYFALTPSIFVCGGVIIGCGLIILDVIFLVGHNHKDLALKIIVCILCLCIVAGSTVGVYYLNKVNKTVDDVFYDGESEQYETISGVFLSKTDHKDLSELEGKRIGMLSETGEGVTSIAVEELDAAGVFTYSIVNYFSILDMCEALYNDEVDTIAVNAGYKEILNSDENTNYTHLVEDTFEFNPFKKEILVEAGGADKNLAKEPFTVLLIGWSRVELGSPVGLADTIILASVNPLTYTVNMMSIARDSYVPISCYGGTKDKINSGRSTSRACFIDTVEDLVGVDVDFYMEFDYDAVVAVVDAVEGVEIYNPVEFTLDGVTVPQGQVTAWGWMALQFCRERHAFDGGDFARQEHQKQVIMGVVEKLLKKKDINMCIKAMQDAGDKLSTNLTWTQLTTLFNLLLNTKNYTGMKNFDLLDFQNTRITGYSSWYYNYGMHLPLWIYKLYEGSIEENLHRMNVTLGNEPSDVIQEGKMEFSCFEGYVRQPLYHETFDEKTEDEEMPDYYADLVGMTLEDALAWADSKGVTLDVEFIEEGSDQYDETKDGLVVKQSPNYGALCSDYPTGTIVVMGGGVVEPPSFIGRPVEEAKAWADRHKVEFEKIVGKYSDDEDEIGTIYDQDFDDEDMVLTVYYYGDIEDARFTIRVEADGDGEVSGGGEGLKYDEKVEIKAKPGSNSTFEGWYVDGEYVSGDAKYTVKVKNDAKYVAKFKSNVSTYHVEVINGTGTGDYSEGSEITIVANDPPEGYVFVGWYRNDKLRSEDIAYTITVTKDMIFEAVYEKASEPDPEEGGGQE
ncbi:MAG: LCP family protein [Firmicutes bacterium]|nr:LCP family protein [Candidatus Colivicinus equi]